jgi:hypothetical protein
MGTLAKFILNGSPQTHSVAISLVHIQFWSFSFSLTSHLSCFCSHPIFLNFSQIPSFSFFFPFPLFLICHQWTIFQFIPHWGITCFMTDCDSFLMFGQGLEYTVVWGPEFSILLVALSTRILPPTRTRTPYIRVEHTTLYVGPNNTHFIFFQNPENAMDAHHFGLLPNRTANVMSAPTLIPVGIPLERQTRPTPKLAFLKAPAGMPKSLTAGLPFLLDSHRNGLNLTRPSPSESPRGTLGSYPVFHLHQRSQRTTGQAERNSKP